MSELHMELVTLQICPPLGEVHLALYILNLLQSGKVIGSKGTLFSYVHKCETAKKVGVGVCVRMRDDLDFRDRSQTIKREKRITERCRCALLRKMLLCPAQKDAAVLCSERCHCALFGGSNHFVSHLLAADIHLLALLKVVTTDIQSPPMRYQLAHTHLYI